MENLQYIKPRQISIASLLYKKPFTTFIVPPVKALMEDQVLYLNGLAPRGLSAFNFRSLCERCCEANKLKLVVSSSDFFLLRKESRSYLLKKSVKP